MEAVGADSLAVKPFRGVRAAEGRLPRFHYGDCFQGTAALRQFAISVESLGDAGPVLPGVPDHEDAARLRVRQRLEQDGIDRAKDGRRAANAERQYHDDRRGEARSLAQLAQRVANVLDHAAHACTSAISFFSSSSATATGSILSRRELTTVKIAVFAPMPSAGGSTADVANPGLLR